MTTEASGAKPVLKSEDALQLEFQAHLAEYENLYKNMVTSVTFAQSEAKSLFSTKIDKIT